MKDGSDLYGWGVFDIPMERALYPISRGPRGLKTAGASVLLTFICLVALLYFDRQVQNVPLPPQPQPVEVAVRILEKAPLPEPQAPEVPPPPSQQERPAAAEAPKTPPVQPRAPVPEPPRPFAATPPPPAEAPLPPPSSLQPVRPAPRQQQTLPERTAPVAEQPAEDILPDPSVSAYAQRREADGVELPRQEAALQNRDAAVDLGTGPKRTRLAERGTAGSTLPAPAKTSLALRSGAESALPAPDATPRYAEAANNSASLPPASPRNLPAGGGGDVDLSLPEAAAPATPGRRERVAMRLPGEREQQSFAGGAEPALSGPTMATATPRASRQIAEAPEGSFEFLDRVGPADVDPSYLMNLNRLRTCLDPEEETALKTRLATMLSAPGSCRSGGVVFFIRHPESAYSIHIDLYNYEQREFKDRCAALRQAVDACGARR